MTDFAALLRGVSPVTAAMPDLRKAFERAGFKDVRTVLASGNVLFSAPSAPAPQIERRAESAILKQLGRPFFTIVREVDALRKLLAADPYRPFTLPAGSKRVVTFLRKKPSDRPKLPIEQDGARILALHGSEIYSAYLPSPKGPVFMTLLESAFGKEITTRTWDTIGKLAR